MAARGVFDTALLIRSWFDGQALLGASFDESMVDATGGPPGICVGSGTALALGSARPVGMATATNIALALSGVQIRAVGMATETSASIAPPVPAIDPATLFTGGVEGAFWDFTDAATLAANADGT